MEDDRAVGRWVTDEVMAAIQQLTGQTYVADAYATSVKSGGDGRRRGGPPRPRAPGAVGRPGATHGVRLKRGVGYGPGAARRRGCARARLS